MDTNDYIREDVASIRRLASGDPDARQIYDKLADDRLVRHAANAMQEKLQLARVKGRGGWWNSDECTIEHLRTLLREHVEKGDMRDVLNLAAMVYVREIADMRPNKNLWRQKYDCDVPVYLAQQPAPSAVADLIAALEEARSAINSMKVEAETAGQGDEQMMLEACETISNEGLQADTAIRAALASAPKPSSTPQADSQPAPVEVADAMADSQYLAGVSAGWNAANADDPNAALQKLHESRAGYLKPLRAARAPADSVTAPAGASKAVLAAIRAANMQLVRTGDDEFMLVTFKQATPQADSQPAPVRDYPPLPDFDTVEQHIYGACRRYITQDMLEPIHNLIRDVIDADRAARAPTDSEIDRLRVALLEAEAGLIMAGADVEPSGDFVPSPTAALRIVRTALVHNA